MNNPAQFDRAALSIVRPGVDGGLSELKALLEAFWSNPSAQADAMQSAQSEAKRMAGVFKMVGLDGLAAYCTEIEAVLSELASHPGSATPVHRDGLENSLQALTQYLDELALGVDNATLRLFPSYQQLQHLRGLEMSFEQDLFFPNLNVKLPPSVLEPAQADNPQAQIKAARSQYQQALVRYLRQLDVDASLQAMQNAMLTAMTAFAANEKRAYWWVAAGFFECLSVQKPAVDMNVPKLLGRIDHQMRAFLEEKELEEQPELNQMLYVIASNPAGVGGLAGVVSDTYALRRYIHDVSSDTTAMLSKRLSVIGEHLQQAEENWDACVGGSKEECDSFISQTRLIEQYCEKLDPGTLQVLARAIAKYAQHVHETEHAQALSVDMAMALLLMGRGLASYHQLHPDFEQQALALSERMDSAINAPSAQDKPIPDLVTLYCGQESMLVRSLLSKEMLANLQRVEAGLNDFFADESKRGELHTLSRDLKQIQGGLHILGLPAAAALSDAFTSAVGRLADADKAVERTESRAVANALSVLESYLTHLPHPAKSEDAALLAAARDLAAAEQGKHPDVTAVMPAIRVEPAALSDEEFELVEVFLEEADEVLAIMRENLELCHVDESSLAPLVTIRRGYHTLKGSGRMVGLNELGEVAWALERAMNAWLQEEKPVTPVLLNMISMSIPRFSEWVDALRRQVAVRYEADDLLAIAHQVETHTLPELQGESAPDMQEVERQLAERLDIEAVPKAAEKIQTAEVIPLVPAPVAKEEPEEAEVPSQVQVGTVSLSGALFKVGSEESTQHVATLKAQLENLAATTPTRIEYDFMRAAHTLAGVNRAMGFTAIVDLAFALECWLQARIDHTFNLQPSQYELLQSTIATLDRMVRDLCARQFPRASSDQVYLLNMDKDKLHAEEAAPAVAETPLLAVAETPVAATEVAEIETPVAAVESHVVAAETPVVVAEAAAAAEVPAVAIEVPAAAAEAQAAPVEGQVAAESKPRATMVRDEVDEQLLPIFMEEADDLLPKIGESLRAWREQPDDAKYVQLLNRLLHTLKGSARMAGAMRIGQIAHEMEDEVLSASKRLHDAAYWDSLDHEFDRITALLEELRTGKPAAQPVDRADARQRATDRAGVEAAPDRRTLEIGAERALQSNMLRVRADVIDRLVNEASEISVARARMEGELRAFKDGLLELTESVSRLRKQLREVEIQAESQMQARVTLAHDSDEQFDPLEFDRFTRLQELTRFMHESVHDVQTVQQALLKNLDETASAMSAQARLNRELQQSLMNVRMVPFNSITDRLYRIVRQTGKELNKRANLELVGTAVELDRSVLEKMTAPFEHLLRNAMAHGLESEEQRNQLGKQPIGEIRLMVKQDNNEVVFDLSDDGAGLDFAALRAKAISQGLMQESDAATEEQLSQLIFASGISTAREVTELAGRGIGMDVVRSEITALGGRIDVTSHRGKGTKFTVHLPLTLAVTQVLMVRCGDTTYAIPAAMVEQVRQVKSAAMEELYRLRQVEWQGNSYPLHYLPQLLSADAPAGENQARNSVLLLRSGEARMALHIDELIGNQEAVVKNIGPQLSRLPGIAGATVRSDGGVVLILNPLQLSQSVFTSAPTKPAVVEMPRKLPLVMVVDDSLTVRKITSRMLTRAGYDVVTAKDGVDALEQLADLSPDVMLLDVEMPRMDGFELTKRLRQDSKTKDIPIIMITSRTADKHRDHALQLGVNAYVGKPYQEEDLLERIAGFAGKPHSA